MYLDMLKKAITEMVDGYNKAVTAWNNTQEDVEDWKAWFMLDESYHDPEEYK